MSVAVQVDPEIRRDTASASGARIVTDGKFLRAGGERFLVKGGRKARLRPTEGSFPPMRQIAADFL